MSSENKPVEFHELLAEAESIVKAKPVWKRYIDGTPLANDVPVWMAVFAEHHVRHDHPAPAEPIGEVIHVTEHAAGTWGQLRTAAVVRWAGDPPPAGTKVYVGAAPAEPSVPLSEYTKLQRLVTSQGIRLMELEAELSETMVEAACKAFSEESFGYSAESRREYMIRSMPMRAALLAAMAAQEVGR